MTSMLPPMARALRGPVDGAQCRCSTAACLGLCMLSTLSPR
jgi:hypothetical protein